MLQLTAIFLVLSAIVLGIFLGAQIAEACLFVPIWKQMDPDDFFEQHKTVGPLLYRFFSPLTIAATFIPLITVVFSLIAGSDHTLLYVVMGCATLAFFSTYFLYFKSGNQKFADRTLSNAELPQELKTWSNWHWTRIGFESIAFVCCIFLLLMT